MNAWDAFVTLLGWLFTFITLVVAVIIVWAILEAGRLKLVSWLRRMRPAKNLNNWATFRKAAEAEANTRYSTYPIMTRGNTRDTFLEGATWSYHQRK